jgi:hypothetical protein
VLDLTFYKRDKSWGHTIRDEKFLGPIINGKNQEFSHIVDLYLDNTEIVQRVKEMRVDPETGR